MNYLERFLDCLEQVHETADGWLASCPALTHGTDGKDHHPSLRVTIGTEGKILIHCRVGCETENILQALNLSFSNLYPKSGELSVAPRVQEPEPLVDSVIFQRHSTYQKLLNLLPLSTEHKLNLIERGLNASAITYGNYRSFSSLSLHLLRNGISSDDHDVPGIHTLINNCTSHLQGLWIPVRDLQGRISAIKVRREGDPKYVYLSSSGSSSHAPCHLAASPLYKEKLIITEGELKADVIYCQIGIPAIGVPGVAHWRKAIPFVESLNPEKVLIAYDWKDVLSNPSIRQNVLDLFLVLQSKHKVGLIKWDSDHKGFDDLLAANGTYQEIWGEDAMSLLMENKDVQVEEENESPPMSFPLDALPSSVSNFISSVSSALPCPPDFVAVSALAFCGVAVGTTRRVEIKPGWNEYPVIYAAIVSAPGQLKSPAIDITIEPAFSIEKNLEATYRQKMKVFQQEFRAWKAKNTAYEAKVKDAYKFGNVPPEPIEPPPTAPTLEAVYAQDVTLEALADVLTSSPRGVLLYHDELVTWKKSMNQYRGGQGGDEQFFLSVWSCPRERKINRKGQEPLVIQRPFVNVLGSIQPDKLGDLSDGKHQDDGFLSRILFSIPQTKAAPDFNFESSLSPEQKYEWEGIIRKLRELDWINGEAKTLTATPEAQQKFLEWHTLHQEEANSLTFDPMLQGVWSKFKAYLARFALISHLLREVCSSHEEVISEQIEVCDIENSWKLIDYFKDHARRAYPIINQLPQDRWAREFVEWVKAKGGKITFKEIYKLRQWGIKGKESALKLIKMAEDKGLGYFGIGQDNQELKVFHAKLF